MTSRHLPIATAASSEVTFFDAKEAKAVDLIAMRHTSEVLSEVFDRIATSAIREMLRDQDCDMIPRIEGLFAIPYPNDQADTLLLEVTYSKKGWRATYGGKWDITNRHLIWTCYAN